MLLRRHPAKPRGLGHQSVPSQKRVIMSYRNLVSSMTRTVRNVVAPACLGVSLPLLAAGLMSTALAQTASADTISVNFAARSAPNLAPGNFLRVESGESSSGVAGTNGNDVWNDVLNAIGTQSVNGNAGEVAGIDWLTGSADQIWSQTGTGTRTVAREDPSGDMMDGHFEGATPTQLSITMSGLADDFSAYDVYLYVGDDWGGRVGSFSINGGPALSFTSQKFTGTFTEVTSPGQAGNYIRFAGITGDSFTIVGGGNDGANRTGVRAIEVVAVPEPTSLALLGLGGLMLMRRRR